MTLNGYPDLFYFLDNRKRLNIYLGPMGLVITARKKGRSVFEREQEVREAVKEAVKVLEEVSSSKDLLYNFVNATTYPENLPRVIRLMVDSARIVSEISGEPLTPMASVAGSIAESMLYFLEERADEIIVNNYGDVAMKMEKAKIGLRDGRGELYGTLLLRSYDKYGICTSGFGGRSLTRGIADGVTCICDSASFADACATVIANSVNVESEMIKREPAEKVYPGADIKGLDVVVEIGDLNDEEIEEAIFNGISMADKLDVKTVIKLKNYIAMKGIEKNEIKLRKGLKILYISL